MMLVGSQGPRDARIMIIGEAPGAEEEKAGTPFIGASGQELDRMLAAAGIRRQDCFVTNVCRHRPPGNDIDEWFYNKTEAKKRSLPEFWGKYPDDKIRTGIVQMWQEIADVKPTLIIALGNTALWALTGKWGVKKWRGSILTTEPYSGLTHPFKVIPTIHPAAVLRNWSDRGTVIRDFERAAFESAFPEVRVPDYQFLVRPSYRDAASTLARLVNEANRGPVMLAVDIETRRRQIACIGVAWTHLDAMCIPLITREGSYWSFEEEFMLVKLMRKLFMHPNVRIVGQNFLYDIQYLTWQWGIPIDRALDDTMIAHHVCFPAMPKGLDFLSSMYCKFHRYWKEEGKDFDLDHDDPEQLWQYNCLDAVATFEIMGVLEELIPLEVKTPDGDIAKPNLEAQYREQMEISFACYRAMLAGVRIDNKKKLEVQLDLMAYASEYEAYFQRIIPPWLHDSGKRKPWYRSPQQCAEIFYDYCKVKPVFNRKTRKITTEGEALRIIGQREPIVRPITDALMQYRSLETIAEAVASEVDDDGRMRCSYGPSNTITFRLSSTQNAWGRGCNMQNVTTGEKYAQEDWKFFPVKSTFPNLRKYFVPDPGCIFLDVDLEKADANVVAAEANDEELLQIFASGADVHTENAKAIFGPTRGIIPQFRQLAKQGVHATNYGITASALARVLNITIKEAEAFQKAWFAAHPGILDWHKRVMSSLYATRSVSNRFGYYIRFEDRVEQCFTEALAWIPQSTVALVINKLWLRILKELPWVQVLMQVHDSLVMQIPQVYYPRRAEVRALAQTIEIPYESPVILRVGLKMSDVSWGDVGKGDWKGRGWDD